MIGDTIHVSGLDILDGSPVLDIKPYIENYDRPTTDDFLKTEIQDVTPSDQVACSSVADLFVDFTPSSLVELDQFHGLGSHDGECCYCMQFLKNVQETKQAIASLLKADPRSVYRRNKCSDRLYYFTLDKVHVTCWFDSDTQRTQVVKVKLKNY